MLDEKRVRELRDHIHNNPQSFDMATWMNNCGTVGCIAGLAVAKYEPDVLQRLLDDHRMGITISVPTRAAELLGLKNEPSLRRHLFTPPVWAVDVLENRADLDIEWQVGSNIGPSAEAVDRMHAWIVDTLGGSSHTETMQIYKLITAQVAVRALDGLLAHPVYVDWAEAIEEAA